MEIFLDGGFFELVIALVIANLFNYIFLKKYLLIVFSALTVAAPVFILFVKKGEAFYWLAFFMLFNSLLLVILLWRDRQKSPGAPLFKIDKFKKDAYRYWQKLKFHR